MSKIILSLIILSVLLPMIGCEDGSSTISKHPGPLPQKIFIMVFSSLFLIEVFLKRNLLFKKISISLIRLYQLWSFSRFNTKHCSFAYPNNCSTIILRSIQNEYSLNLSKITSIVKNVSKRHLSTNKDEPCLIYHSCECPFI